MVQLLLASMSIRYLIMLAKCTAQRPIRTRQRPPRLDETLSSSIDTCARNHSEAALEIDPPDTKKAARASFEFCLLTSRGSDARPA